LQQKFKGKYRIPSTRWATWTYGNNTACFVTLCMANRACDFGSITNGNMFLTPLGRSALYCWNEIPAHFPFVDLGEFAVMPNHVHGIVTINKPDPKSNSDRNQKNLASIIRGYWLSQAGWMGSLFPRFTHLHGDRRPVSLIPFMQDLAYQMEGNKK
jgi:REP element-mobilizing transposase RayT